MYCVNCGEKLKKGAKVCPNCGHAVDAKGRPVYENEIDVIPDQYRPISMWGYFGYQILFAIPVIGFIFLIIFALGGHSNVNVKNYARSYFCMLLIVVILIVILAASGVLAEAIDALQAA